jgi:hypothetical protein
VYIYIYTHIEREIERDRERDRDRDRERGREKQECTVNSIFMRHGNVEMFRGTQE